MWDLTNKAILLAKTSSNVMNDIKDMVHFQNKFANPTSKSTDNKN